MKRTALVAAAVLLVFAPSAAAAKGPTIPWATGDMTKAVKALGYPKPHAKKLTCKAVGNLVGVVTYASFKCVATYRHHHRIRFAAAGRGEGGWICAGAKLSRCHVLQRGFVADSGLETGVKPSNPLGLEANSVFASEGYIQNKYGVRYPQQPGGSCPVAAGALAWSCEYANPAVTVTITFKAVKGGYLIFGSAQPD